ncbi:MAG: helix-turn-helix transcriptional regulator [Lachnospiraceae bacterium]|nr:helix-turn-helix transcriptional regulator [Lachnospiraceae bacterium]
MEPFERIRILRKENLNMTLDEFSSKINISRSNLGNIETGRIRLTERVISDICRSFHVRQDWIVTGNEPIFEDDRDPLNIEITKLYSSLSDENKKYLYGYIQRLLEEQHDN